MNRNLSELSFKALIAAAVPLISFASPSRASEIQSLWCAPGESQAFFILSETSQEEPEIWIDGNKMQLKETALTDSGTQYWLVNIENATFVEVLDLSSADTLSLNGVVNGKVTNTTCEDVTTAFLSGLRLSESLILKDGERITRDAALTRQKIDDLSEQLEQKNQELLSLRDRLKESQASVAGVETSFKEIEAMRSNLASLENFVSLVRADLVTEKNLPADYVDLFNERYWSMRSTTKE